MKYRVLLEQAGWGRRLRSRSARSPRLCQSNSMIENALDRRESEPSQVVRLHKADRWTQPRGGLRGPRAVRGAHQTGQSWLPSGLPFRLGHRPTRPTR